MIEFEALSPHAAEAASILGNGSPTVHAADKRLKVWVIDDDGGTYSCYFTSEHLREIGGGLIEIANWLDARAAAQMLADSEALRSNPR